MGEVSKEELLNHIFEQDSCEDAVSRKQAIEFVNEVIGGKNEFADAIREGVEAVLSAVPPVEPVQKWIPISEELPKCEQKVLVLTLSRVNTHVITTGMYEDGSISECDSIWNWEYVDFEKWDEENECGIIPEGWYEYHEYNPDGVLNYEIYDKVLAWMPLPKEYKEEVEGKE